MEHFLDSYHIEDLAEERMLARARKHTHPPTRTHICADFQASYSKSIRRISFAILGSVAMKSRHEIDRETVHSCRICR
jgi:hypothetical protein